MISRTYYRQPTAVTELAVRRLLFAPRPALSSIWDEAWFCPCATQSLASLTRCWFCSVKFLLTNGKSVFHTKRNELSLFVSVGHSPLPQLNIVKTALHVSATLYLRQINQMILIDV
jgi:hypothetical protein